MVLTAASAIWSTKLDNVQAVLGFAGAALQGGAAGLRIEGADHVRAVCACHDVPVIGLIKRDLSHSPVRITPYLEDVKALSSHLHRSKLNLSIFQRN